MDLLRRFHPSREKSPANQPPDKNHSQATLVATLDTLAQPWRIAIAPNTAVDKQIATATKVRVDGDFGVIGMCESKSARYGI
jgi:hypothetical protein